MTPDRFRTIVDAYGAEPRRWPATERDAAQAWVAAHPAEADAILAAAAPLDAWLSQDVTAAPDTALFDRVLASAACLAPAAQAAQAAPAASAASAAPAAQAGRSSPRSKRPLGWRRGRVWWSSVVLAGAGLAGGYAGALAVSLSMVTTTLPSAHDEPWMTTGFGAPVADWSEE
jgi:hypothetical protein